MLEQLRRTLRTPVSFPQRRLAEAADNLASAFVCGEHCLLFRQLPFDFRPMRHGAGLSRTEGGVLALEFIATLAGPSLAGQAGAQVARHAAAEIGALLADPGWLRLDHDLARTLAASVRGMPPLAALPQTGINITPNGWNDGMLVHKTSCWHQHDARPGTRPDCPALIMDLWMELLLQRCEPLLHDDGDSGRSFMLRARLRGLQAESALAAMAPSILHMPGGRFAALAQLGAQTGGWLADCLRRRGIRAGVTTPARHAALLASRPHRMPNPGGIHGSHRIVLPQFPCGGVIARQFAAVDNGRMRLTITGERVDRSDTAHRAPLLMRQIDAWRR